MFSETTLPEQTAGTLLKYIKSNNYEVGAKIPSEYELAKMFGVGRSTIREAVRLLASRNILIVKRGSGTYVADRTGITDDPLGLSFETDIYSLAWDLVNVRIVIEPEIASWAAANATDDEIKEIKKQCAKIEELNSEGKDYGQEDVRFHELVAKSSGNKIMEKLIPIIDNSVLLFADIASKELKDETIATHRRIVDAISDRDAASAKYAMIVHLSHYRTKIAEKIKVVKENEYS